jgi:AcrR family transcriptional regulator
VVSLEKDFSLRERKYAKTKIALASAFIERLKTTKFSEISIKEVCESVEVSEGTFYNYFPQKADVVFYYKQIMDVRMACAIDKNLNRLSPKELLEFTFDFVAKEIEQPYLFYEVISLFTAEKKKPKELQLTPAEKCFACPDYARVQEVPAVIIEESFSSLVKQAKKQGEFKKDVKPEDVALALQAILVGVPLAIDIEDFAKLKIYYRTQLSLLWKAIGEK